MHDKTQLLAYCLLINCPNLNLLALHSSSVERGGAGANHDLGVTVFLMMLRFNQSVLILLPADLNRCGCVSVNMSA